jgi:hypothetical protein
MTTRALHPLAEDYLRRLRQAGRQLPSAAPALSPRHVYA